MGIAITHEQRELARSVRRWLTRAVPAEDVRKHLDAPALATGRPGYWEGAVAQGLTGVHLPEECGGGGGDLVDLAVVLEEAARALLPGPYLPTVLAAELLHRAGRAGDAAALAAGERIGAVALGAGAMTAVRTDGGYVLDGTAPPVLGAAAADLLVLAATAADGTVWFAVDADTLAVRPHESADPTRPTAEVAAHGVLVPADRALTAAADETGAGAGLDAGLGSGLGTGLGLTAGGADTGTGTGSGLGTGLGLTAGGADTDTDTGSGPDTGSGLGFGPGLDTALVRDLAAVLFAADACGTAARALDLAAEHARTRVQFGRPIGRFQGVKHLCADMLVRLEQARALTWDAARAARDAEAGVRSLTAALAAATALDTAYTVAKDCIQILGGIGFTWEHDAHLHLRRALVARQLLGPGDTHRVAAVRHAANGARRALRLQLPPEADGFRAAARAALAPAAGLDPPAARRALAGTGYAAPHLPEPYGLGAGPLQQLAVQREAEALGITLSPLSIATWVIPSLIAYGTPEQKERHLGPTLRGEQRWCQLFSEPEAGSDLASLRTRARPLHGGGWRIDGQKVWTSAAKEADYGILLARTDPDAPKHRGLTYFLVDMRNTPGIHIRPLKEITGESLFNEVWFDDAVLPADAVVGEPNDGWRVARHTLGNERVHMADQVAFDTGLEALIGRAGGADGPVRVRLGALVAEAHALACIDLRTTLRQVSGLEPGPGASVRKLVQTVHQQKVAELALELLGPAGAVAEGAGERAVHGLLMSRCLTIAGGTTQVQLNVVAERLLGLPRD
ncbi:acyl-CoA dehydrogenase [Streptomyces sp. NPDC006339]|uniref:acyl-CoA dehydrogenase n=1 Tax=Streptomyces sp. NPDC006339 TaxID=3156755 RepID=UPI0033AB64F4